MPDSSRVLVLNSGSSSLKFALLDPHSGEQYLSGIGEALGSSEPLLSWRSPGQKHSRQLDGGAAHAVVIELLVRELLEETSLAQGALIAVGHRVVHGGERFARSALIDQQVIDTIAECADLAPLHNPPGLLGIHAAINAFPELPQVAVFDTAFHQTLPRHAYLYALPYSLYRDQRIRRYGMHGSSHRFVSERAADLLGKPLQETNLISAHLGNGASLTAVKNGESVDTSMGLTPLEGLVMGTRCGDVDAGLLMHLGDALGFSLEKIGCLLNRESGLLGISELSNDCRELERAAAEGHDGARLALEIFCYRLAKYIAAYTVPLQRIDALVFTGGIGENSAFVRQAVLCQLQHLGYQLDNHRNQSTRFGAEGRISKDGTAAALVIPTNEEWIIARDAASLVERGD
ncbi:acetate kinase [Microbulbifer donghaiensis]|uniref:Acetate kinase n=1 Tax=Microbulbifer donghaiensis TaxID=494016 RepID=A0A1M4V465_9GAMM|nr:acetate kinase [Microbulbifer donghaiensis]SHE63774.1 acetate kinase [Microbulbifer donghaiensis]